MDTNSSVTLTKRIIITSSNPVAKEDFVKKIKEFASNIITFLKKNGCKKLGHIKVISTTDGEDYLQLSILGMKQRPEVQGILRKTFEKIKLTFNLIEFGVCREKIDSKLDEEIKNMQTYFVNR